MRGGRINELKARHVHTMYNVLSADAIRNLSVVEIVHDQRQLITGQLCSGGHAMCDGFRGHPTFQTLCDVRMGPRVPSERCATCGHSFYDCMG